MGDGQDYDAPRSTLAKEKKTAAVRAAVFSKLEQSA